MISRSSEDSPVRNSTPADPPSDEAISETLSEPTIARPIRRRRKPPADRSRNTRGTNLPSSEGTETEKLPGDESRVSSDHNLVESEALKPLQKPKVGRPRKPRDTAHNPERANNDLPTVTPQTLDKEQSDSLQPVITDTKSADPAEPLPRPQNQGTSRKRERLTKGPDETTQIPFMHPSEREFAQILDYYNIEYLYEPRSFPLRWDGARVVEMFSPDFYLPVQDQYFELTTMKQSLVTQKNRKLRHLNEMYPEINCQLLYRRDIMRLLAKYGHGPLADAGINGVERTLFTADQISEKVRAIGAQITADFAEQEVVLVGVLKGVICFMADLMRTIDLPLRLDFIEIAQYGEGIGANVAVSKDIPDSIEGRHVILVEDIVDTGMTVQFLLGHLWDKQPASVSVCALLNKPIRRMNHVDINYCGFDIPDEFVVGYGLDYGGKYRNLPSIGVLRPVEAKPETEVEVQPVVD